jgi:hypothetical protein
MVIGLPLRQAELGADLLSALENLVGILDGRV